MSQPVMSCNNSHHHQPASNSAFDNRGASSSGISTTSYHSLHESLPRAATSGTSFDRSRQTPVIVAASSSSSSAYTPDHLSSTAEVSSSSSTLYSAAATTASAPYATAHTYHPSSESSTAVPSPVLQPSCSNSSSGGFICPSNFFQPYYGLSPTLSEFSVLQMCCQPLFSEIASQGADTSPTAAESLYGFANRLHPITSTGAHQQISMPQAYQTRTGYAGNTMTRPASAAGKRGGRRPKEYEEYDHVTLSEEERDKRDKRRLRNKEAAARCRQRRLDLMGSLQNQVDQLKEENKMKDTKIAELQLLKNELIAVIRDHHCILPDSLRQTLDVDMSSTHQYMPRGAPVPATVPTTTEIVSYPPPAPSPQTILGRKRPASEMIPELRQAPQPNNASSLSTSVTLSSGNQTSILTLTKPSSMQIKQEPTLYDVNGRDLPDEEIKRPTTLSFSENGTTTTAYSSLSSSGVPITTPSNLIGGGASDFGAVNLLDGPTGLTPCHPPQATAFQLSNMATPLGEGRSFETL